MVASYIHWPSTYQGDEDISQEFKVGFSRDLGMIELHADGHIKAQGCRIRFNTDQIAPEEAAAVQLDDCGDERRLYPGKTTVHDGVAE
jgi:hypothetical protein